MFFATDAKDISDDIICGFCPFCWFSFGFSAALLCFCFFALTLQLALPPILMLLSLLLIKVWFFCHPSYYWLLLFPFSCKPFSWLSCHCCATVNCEIVVASAGDIEDGEINLTQQNLCSTSTSMALKMWQRLCLLKI